MKYIQINMMEFMQFLIPIKPLLAVVAAALPLDRAVFG
jgi:hypothetical protein